MKPKSPPVPAEQHTTIRRRIIDRIAEGPLSARELSAEAGIPEKDVCRHLEHIRRSLQKEEGRLVVTPSICKKCGFIFRKRQRLQRPGKCPVCRGESITEPLFALE
jgi:predicted Zn-ribbon and HTH transcriptional regulator